MARIIIFTAFVACSLCGFSQQDPNYNLYQFNQMAINPAYAGARDVLAIVAMRRQQWIGVKGSPETTCLSIHSPVMKRNLGIGLTLLNDKTGPRNVLAIYGNVAYILKLNERVKLSFGLNAGYNRFQLEYNNIDLKTGQLPAELFGTPSTNLLDINSGIYLRSKTFFMGISATHINNPGVYAYQDTLTESRYAYKLTPHLFLTAGKSFEIGKNLVVAPTVIARYINGGVGMDVNLNFLLHRRLWLGTFYRSAYGAGGLIQFYINNKIRAGLSYDTGLGEASRLGPSFEVMVGFDMPGARAKTVDVRFL
jgi:type IX secretion system PorP/SprF family membrane protein